MTGIILEIDDIEVNSLMKDTDTILMKEFHRKFPLNVI